MPFIPQIAPEEATGPLKDIFDQCQKRAGYIANILRLQSLDAQVLAASVGFYTQLMKRPTALSNARKEMLAAVVSHVNDCFY